MCFVTSNVLLVSKGKDFDLDLSCNSSSFILNLNCLSRSFFFIFKF